LTGCGEREANHEVDGSDGQEDSEGLERGVVHQLTRTGELNKADDRVREVFFTI
jgi:hypothetical protein